VAEFELQDVAGQPLTRASLQGQPTLVFFGFTHCPDVCPTTLLKLAQVRRQAGLAQLRVLFISVDPQRDSPQALGAYVHAFDPQFLGATGTPAGIAALASGFGVAVNRVELPGGDYTMDHSAVVFLLDDAANIAAIFTPPFDTEAMARDLQRAAPYLKLRRSSG
jgi:protein SCO1/2